MATAFSILQDFSSDQLKSVERLVNEFLQPVFTDGVSLGSAEAKGYGSFAVKFLHISVTKLKSLTDVGRICELLRAVERCCACYLKVQGELSFDDEFYVPKLVFHVLNSVRHEDGVAQAVFLSEHMFTFLSQRRPLSAAGEKITQSLFCCLWNLANTLGPQKENKINMETVLEIRKHALFFACLLPNMTMLTERIYDTMLHVTSFNKDSKDRTKVESYNKLSIQIFSDILKQLKPANDSIEISLVYLRVVCLYMEHLIKIRNFSILEQECFVISTDLVINTASDRKQMLEILLYLYRLAARIKALSTNRETLLSAGEYPVTKGDNSLSKGDKTVSQKKDTSSNNLNRGSSKTKNAQDNFKQEKLKADNFTSRQQNGSFIPEFAPQSKEKSEKLEKLIINSSHEEVSQIFMGFQFVCTLIGAKPSDLACFSTEMIEILLTCTTHGLIASKSMLTHIQKEGNHAKTGHEIFVNGRKRALKPEAEASVHQTLLMICFKNLLLSYQVLQNCNSSPVMSIYESISGIASQFENYLEFNRNTMPPKSMNLHRNNCAYICSKIAGHCMRQVKNYDLAILLNTIVLRQLRMCGSSQTNVPIELLIECYKATSRWQEAVQIVVESAILDRDTTSCIVLWVDLKRDALASHQDAFVQWTLSCLIDRQENHQLDLAELLMSEFCVWKRISRRDYRVEFYILSELLGRFDSGLQKFTYMIELAKNMCITGLIYKQRSAGGILSEVIDELDDFGPESQAILALANFTKYVVSHEETVMNLNTKLQKREDEMAVKVDETGDTNQNTSNRSTSQASTNQKTPDKSTSLVPTNQDSCFTLATEKPYLKYLHNAVELWEKCMGSGTENDGIDLNSHIEALVACGTRLIAMKQPSVALRVLRVAQCQITNLKDSNYTSHLEEKLAKVLMLLGMYAEAEKLITTNASKSHVTTSRLLLKAELYLLMGKKQEGMDILNQVLGQDEGAQLTKSLCLASGCAKRLLSVFLCFPGEHLVGANSQYLLTLANDAVRRHISVLRLVDKPETGDKKSDCVEKWTSVLETLQSLLHLCQLYRLTGLPRNALCYLREGLRISQAQGLPRWACEFLFEILRVSSLEADTTSAVETIDGINRILDSKFDSQLVDVTSLHTPYIQDREVEQSSSKKNLGSVNHIDSLDPETENSPGCFGFENVSITPKVNAQRSSTTPGKDVAKCELSSCEKQKLSQISIPQCQCSDTVSRCSDADVHRLYSEAALVISEFLTVSDNKTKARDILHELLGDDKMLIDFNKVVSNSRAAASGKVKSKAQCVSSSLVSEHLVPSLKFLSLEANCIMAETFGRDRKYNEVQKIWHHVKDLDESGFFVDVLHSNILVARLALCEATSFLQSLQLSHKNVELDVTPQETNHVDSLELDLSPNNTEVPDIASQTEKTSETDISLIEEKFVDLTLSKRKVTFGERDEVFLVQDSKLKSSQTKVRSSRKKIFSNKENNSEPTEADVKVKGIDLMTPKKKTSGNLLNNVLSTPKNQNLYHTPAVTKSGANLHTSWSVKNRKMDLDRLLLDSDDDDEMPVFPALKPVTPKSDMPIGRKAAKSKTEPKKSRKKTACPTKGIVCDLTKTYQESCSPNENDDKSRSASDTSDKAKKHTDLSYKATDSQEMAEKVSRQPSIHEVVENKLNEIESEGLSAQNNNKKVCAAVVKGKKTDISKRKLKDNEKSVASENPVLNSGCDEVKTEKKLGSSRKFLSKGFTSKTEFEKTSNRKENDHAENGSLRHDVFDFDGGSPVVNPSKKGQRGKSSKTNTKTKIPVDKNSKVNTALTKGKNVTASISVKSEEENKSIKSGKNSRETEVPSRDSNDTDEVGPAVSIPESSAEEEVLKTRRGRRNTTSAKMTTAYAKRTTRGKKQGDEIEVPRIDNFEYDLELNVSVDSIKISSDSEDEDNDSVARGIQEISIRLRETASEASNDSERTVSYPHDQSPDLEPIETMRGGRKPAKGKERQKLAKSVNEGVAENGSDESETGVEEMRSSKMPLSLDLSRSLNCVDASVRSSSNSGTSSPDQQDIISALENVYQQIRRLAPYPQHSDICQILALHHLHTNPRRAAFLLSDSIAVTFRHQAMLNLNKKVRKQKTDVTDESVSESSSLQAYVDGLFFNKDENNLQDMIDSIPPDWTVLQVSVVNHGAPHQPVLLTRFARTQTPVVVQVPGFSSPQGRQILSNFTSIIKKSQEVMKITVKADWWKIRRDLDAEMESLVDHMEKFWLGHWRGLLTPRQFTDERLYKLVKEIKKQTKIDVDPCQVEILLHSVEYLKDRELHRCTSELLESNCSFSKIEVIVSLVKETAASEEKTSSGHVVLILDKTIQHLPWECLPVLRTYSVSRMPCLSHLYTQLNYLQSLESSIFTRGVNPESTYYMVNPDSDLPNSQSLFKDWFQSEKGWAGIVGQPPTKEQFAEAITDHDLFIYVGHGSGGRYFHGDDIEKLQGRAAIILMGCSSGKLSVKGQLEPSGMMISYFLAGCPCMIANLWDVTDRDIDKYLQHLLTTWLASENGTLLSKVVQESRQACKMKYLVGCAPVVYGLPVVIKK